MRNRLSLVLRIMAAAAVFVPAVTAAHDLGTQGTTFDIIELDLLKMMSKRLHAAEADGSIDRLNHEFAERAQKKIMNPPAVLGVTDTTKPRTWLYDPSIIVPQDYADQNGQVFAHKGDKINPLEREPTYNDVLVFINGKDAAQVKFAMAQKRKYGAERVRLILTNGSAIDLNRKNTTMFYFDQQGILTRKFGITQVPAMVTRENNLLRISEVTP